jgi:hypothetical protein
MPDYGLDVLWVDLFTFDEYVVLCERFRVAHSRCERSIGNILDEWIISGEIYWADPTDAAIARILPERVPGGFPRWVGGLRMSPVSTAAW